MIAEIIINSNVKKLNRIFDYKVPAEMVGTINIGSRVIVPFGNKQKQEEGFVLNLKDSSMFKLKEIIKVEDTFSLTEDNIELAKLMAQKYFCNISDCIKLMLPPGTTTKIIENRVKDKSKKFISLRKNIEDIEYDIENKILKSNKQIRLLNFLKENDGISLNDAIVFTETTSAVVKSLSKKGYIDVEEKEIKRNPFIHKELKTSYKLKLNKEQQNAFNIVMQTINKEAFEEFLLYGVTGSGKTEIYMQLIEEVIKNKKTAIMLVPEISLTPQTVDRFISRFGKEKIAILHSRLSVGERYDEWKKIHSGEASIVIGARSAIFAPVNNLGIIIIDEEHDMSYKSDMTPRYNAKEISRYLAKKNNIPLILGSATPDICSFYNSKQGKNTLLKLATRANDATLPDLKIVDLREELAHGNRTMISSILYEEINKNIKNKEQTILFLNRRGYSTFVMCRNCGYTLTCKNCNITLTYHLKSNKLKCHYCGYEQQNIHICPECASNNIRYFGTGTQKLEQEILKLFPNITTIRMDIDTVGKKNSHEMILNKFKDENIDILIGTQMVVKGHHFPNVTLVGAIAADSNLNIEDYRANERTFQILTQVAGRAGRDKKKGRVIIQTYNPDNFAIECVKKQDYAMFYNQEINIRKQLKYPPFCDIIVIGISGEDEGKVKNVIEIIYNNILKQNISYFVSKPMPCPIDKIKNRYRYRIIIKTKLNSAVIEKINSAIKFQKEKNIRQIIEINPNNMT